MQLSCIPLIRCSFRVFHSAGQPAGLDGVKLTYFVNIMTKGLALGQLWKTYCCKSADLITDVIDYFREFYSILQGRFICLNFQFHVFGSTQRRKACLNNSILWGHSLWGAEEGALIWGGGAYFKFCLVVGAALQAQFFKIVKWSL